MSNIVILGAGNVGSPLAEASRRAGHSTTTVTRSTDLQAAADALRAADLVVLAVPFAAVGSLTPELRAALEGRVVIDATNPLTADFSALTVGFDTSAAEQIASALPGCRVVKALNAVLAPHHDPAAFPPRSVFVPVAGDDPTAVDAVVTYLASLGFAPVAAGPLANARYFEPLAELLVQLAYFQGLGTGISLALQRVG